MLNHNINVISDWTSMLDNNINIIFRLDFHVYQSINIYSDFTPPV